MDKHTFEIYRDLIYRVSGIALGPEKVSLLESRIQKRLRATGATDEIKYLEIIETDASGDELRQLINVISTNTTYFYREPIHFEMLANILKERSAAGQSEIKIWCAAASSGQEPYNLAITCCEALQHTNCTARILATDISTKVLTYASAGQYTDKEMENVPHSIRSRYFCAQSQPSGLVYSANPQLRQILLFKKFNLIEFPYPLKGPFDVIFCRNVMIYFDRQTRQKIVEQFTRLLAPKGHLFLSLSESLVGIEHKLEKQDASVFTRPKAL